MSFEVTVTGAALADAAGWAAKLAPALSSQPVVGGVLLGASTFQGGDLSFYATDYSTDGRLTLNDADVTDSGRRLVSARLLADIARTIAKEPQVTLADNPDDRRLDITVGDGASWSLPLMPAEDFPSLPTPATPLARVNAVAFARAVEKASLALSEPELPPFFGGIVLDGHQGPLSVVTGSKYRVAVAELDWTPAQSDAVGEPAGFPPVLVPGPVLSAVLRAAGRVGDVDDLLLHSDGHTFGVSGPGFHVTGRIGADIPPWRGADMTTKLDHAFGHVDVDAASLRTALDRVAPALESTKEAIAVEITDTGAMSISGTSIKAAAAHPVDVLDMASGPCRYGIKLSWARDLVACLAADTIRLDLLGKPHAAQTLGRALDDDGNPDDHIRMSIAPIRLTDTATSAA